MSKIYQIVSLPGGAHLSGRKASSDTAARAWLQDLLSRGVIAGIAVKLQRYEGHDPTPQKITSDWLFANSTSANWVTMTEDHDRCAAATGKGAV